MLTEEQTKQLVKIFRKYFLNAYKMIFMIDQKQADNFKDRNIYYYEQQHQNHNHKHDHNHDQKSGCCGTFFAKIYIPYKEQTPLEKIVHESFSKFNVKENMPKLLKYCSDRFMNIKKGGEKDKLVWDTEAEVYILNEVLREGLQLYFQKEIKKQMQTEHVIDSKQQLLLATPQTWTSKHPKIPLEFLSGPFIESLMKKGHGQMNPFIKNKDFTRALFKELDYLERDGRFEDQIQESGIRQDKTLWVTLSQIEKESFKNIYFIAHILSALPYELNSKAQILAQISEAYQFSYFNKQRTQHKMHYDSSFEKNLDTGKKVTILYACLEDEHSQNRVIVDGVEYVLEQDIMIGLMSRKVPYEVIGDGSKFFLVRYWIDGPSNC
ncbi:hypothetical protein pb186bvf_005684 [Paramecium bursaria]